ncbi:MAG: lipoprotein-releasing system ATP-binding protein LolD [Flavobacteriaceae bacterium]|nr:lipoprotein-releasing system ATP-binding protein LolD [Flavobacteriaceae bacterium]
MIKLKNISKFYGSQKILDNISLDVKKGEFISIIGPSGAGKTTLLNIIGTIEDFSASDKTELTLNDIDIHNLNDNEISEFRNKNIGFIFQFHQLLPELNLEENIFLPSLIGKYSKSEYLKKLKDLAKLLGIEKLLKKYPDSISGGERQRVAVARSLINGPKILLADEPTGNLDSKNEQIIMDLFKKLNKELGLTIILVTHNNDFAKISNKCYTLKDGKWS